MGEIEQRPDAERERRNEFVNRRRQSMGSVGPFLIELNGRYRLFEFNGISGPVLVDKDWNPLARQPAASSPFWAKFEAWRKAGCYVDKHNRAFVPSERILRGVDG